MLTTLIYRSQLSLTCTSAALSALVEQARIRNTEQGISGILLSRGRDVLQILEGTEQRVVALFNTIRADDRHTGVVEPMRDYGPRRCFEDVGMLLFDLDVQTPKAVLASVLHYSKLDKLSDFSGSGLQILFRPLSPAKPLSHPLRTMSLINGRFRESARRLVKG